MHRSGRRESSGGSDRDAACDGVIGRTHLIEFIDSDEFVDFAKSVRSHSAEMAQSFR